MALGIPTWTAFTSLEAANTAADATDKLETLLKLQHREKNRQQNTTDALALGAGAGAGVAGMIYTLRKLIEDKMPKKDHNQAQKRPTAAPTVHKNDTHTQKRQTPAPAAHRVVAPAPASRRMVSHK